MKIHLEREIDRIYKRILELSADVEKSLEGATLALLNQDTESARKVIEYDHIIDQHEVDLEEECLKVLSLYQPVATDLRRIVAILKINNDLERIGDLAKNIAEYVIEIKRYGTITIPDDFRLMLSETRKMLHLALDAFMNEDTALALKISELDNRVDKLNVKIILCIKERIPQEMDKMDSLFYLMSASRNIERVADYAENIAQDVYYMATGKIIRHHFMDVTEGNDKNG